MNKLNIFIASLNNLSYTKDLLSDLFKQTHPYNLTLFDQGSQEEGAKEYFQSLSAPGLKVIFNGENVPLNWLWNRFYEMTEEPYLCSLNNDVRITNNFVEDTIQILDKEPTVGCVVHASNSYNHIKSTPLNYVISKNKFIQGWDYTLRRELYRKIPENLLFFGGDDWLFHNMYDNGWTVAVALSSPIIHFHGLSRRGAKKRIRTQDDLNVKALGLKRLPYGSEYSRPWPGERLCQMFIK